MNGLQKNRLEWAVFSFSLTLVLAVIAYLLFASMRYDSGTAQLIVELGQPRRSEGNPRQFEVPFTVRNDGNLSAESVLIEVTLSGAGLEIEKSEIEVPLVPFQSAREGVVIFQQDPNQGEISGRIVRYLHP
jgi:uncharacterized protein (TIGR02588 family)